MKRVFLSITRHVQTIMRMRWVFGPIKAWWIKFKLRFVKATDQRKINRYRCQIDAAMVSGRLARIEGRIKDMSIGGCLFRPASFYLVERAAETVTIQLGDHVLEGKVVRTLPIGYAVQFDEFIENDILADMLKLSAVEASLFNKSQEDETRDTQDKAAEAA